MSVFGNINERLDALFDSSGEPCGKSFISKGETCHVGKSATSASKQRPVSKAGVMRPLGRNTDYKSAIKRRQQIESVVSKLEKSPAFKIDDRDIFSSDAQGKLGALTALRDAANPRVGIVGVTDSRGNYAGFVSYKPGQGEIEIENFGTNQSEKGLGRKLFDKLIDEAANQGMGLSAASVEDAVGFYEKMGMKREGGNAMYMSAEDVKRAAIARKQRKDGYFLARDLDTAIAPRSVKSDESSNDKLTPKEKRQRKVRKVMREFKNGELMIGRSDKPVKSRKQAIAIALNSKLDSDEYGMGYIASESEEMPPMTVRPSCSECLEKHLGAAMVLLAEAETDYPEHRLLAIGHLHEAEEESRAAWPGISLAIRQMRKRLQQDNITPDFYQMARMLQLMDGDGDEDVMVMLDRLDSAGQDLKKTPAKPSEKITGSDRNKSGSAGSGRGGIDLDDNVISALKSKVEQHNEEGQRKVNLGQLKAVYRRGSGAFSTSHHPNANRHSWSMGRVNKFLKMTDGDRVLYEQDVDLLPKDHPARSDSGYIYVHFDSAGAVRIDRNPFRDRAGRFASKAGAVASPVASWAAGKVVGGALASVAASHGIDPNIAKQVSESAVQALATVGQRALSKPTTAKQFAKDFVIESASVFAGKMPYTIDDSIIGGDNEVADVLSLAIANRGNIGAVLNGMTKEVATVGKLLKRKGLRMDAIDWDDLTQDELDALFKLSLVGAVMKDKRFDSFITFDDAKAGFEQMRDEVYSKYKAAVNMSASELEKWAETDASKQASLSNAPIKRNLRLLSKPKSEWNAKDVHDANRTISFVARMRGASQGEKNTETGYSDRDVSLKNWAFDPAK